LGKTQRFPNLALLDLCSNMTKMLCFTPFSRLGNVFENGENA
jgi:hypothetical protein